VGIALLVGGVLFLVAEWLIRGRKGNDQITWTIAIAVGVGQLVAAVFPGASRSGTTIIVALILGLNRTAATEFTFLLGIPTMLAASGLKIFKALHHPPVGAVPEDWSAVGLGFLVSAVVSFVVVKWLLGYVRNHTFSAFGYYRIAAGLLILIALRRGSGQAGFATGRRYSLWMAAWSVGLITTSIDAHMRGARGHPDEGFGNVGGHQRLGAFVHLGRAGGVAFETDHGEFGFRQAWIRVNPRGFRCRSVPVGGHR
jgi:hypothetical protein